DREVQGARDAHRQGTGARSPLRGSRRQLRGLPRLSEEDEACHSGRRTGASSVEDVTFAGLGRSVVQILKLGATLLFVMTLTLVADPVAGARSGPTAGPNNLVDLDHGALFPQNKQNEPSITRDPLTGALIAGANDELSLDLCRGTTTPLA